MVVCWRYGWHSTPIATARGITARRVSFVDQAVPHMDRISGTWDVFTGEEALAPVFEQAPVGMAVLHGRELRYTFANPKYQQIIGSRDPVGRRIVELFPELRGSEIEAVIERVYDTAEPFAATDLLIRYDSQGTGEIDNFYDLAYHPLIASTGETRGVLVVAVDVTERHALLERARALAATEAARAEAEAGRARLGELFRQSPAFIAVLRGPDYTFEMANDHYFQLVGNRDIVGKRLLDALPEARGQGFLELMDLVIATGEPHVATEFPVRVSRTSDAPAEERILTFVYQPLVEPDGTRSGIFAHGIDVTETVQARRAVEATTAALVASEARYRLLAEAVPVQVWTARPDGTLDFVSEQTAAYLGVSSPQLLAIGWDPFVHPDDLTAMRDNWSHTRSSGKPYQSEFRLRDAASAHFRWHLARALPEHDTNGNVVGWVGSNTDVEDERQARADAEAANRAKGDFLAQMSHELRTPLNAIGGYAELIEMGVRGPVTPEQRADLERIRRSQRHLLGLINGVLTYAKVDAGVVQYVDEDVSLDEVLATCEALTAPQMRAKQLRFVRADCAPTLMARADSEKVLQVVLNLLANAVNFTEPGGNITVSCGADDDAHVILTVSDTGVGIANDQVERVFQPFVQVDAVLTRTHEGTGLGLAISRDLARGMGGDLTVRSALGVGSTFTFTLPRAPSP